MTRTHVEQIEVKAAPGVVFTALITPSSIRQWWSTDRAIVVAELGGVWAASWGENEDDPDYISSSRIGIFDSPKCLMLEQPSYYAKTGGPPFKMEGSTRFDIEPTADGCQLRVTQEGFPEGEIGDEFYAACEKGWQDTLAAIKQFVETAD